MCSWSTKVLNKYFYSTPESSSREIPILLTRREGEDVEYKESHQRCRQCFFDISSFVDGGWQSFLATVMFPSQELNYHLACLVCHHSLVRHKGPRIVFLLNTEFAIFMTRLDWVECKQQAPSGQWFRSPMSGLGNKYFTKDEVCLISQSWKDYFFLRSRWQGWGNTFSLQIWTKNNNHFFKVKKTLPFLSFLEVWVKSFSKFSVEVFSRNYFSNPDSSELAEKYFLNVFRLLF